MQKNSLAFLKPYYRLFFIFAFFTIWSFLFAQEPGIHPDEVRPGIIQTDEIRWYLSNSSGMILDPIPSRLAAMRAEYSLSIRSALPRELPEFLLPNFNSAFRIELRTLYNEGSASRFLWIFRDGRGMTRFTAAGTGSRFSLRTPDGYPPEENGEDLGSGIIEIRNSEGAVTREFQYDENLAEWDYRYFYRDGVLLRTEIWFKESPHPVVEENDEEENGEDNGEDNGEPLAEPLPVIEPIREPPVFVLLFTDRYRYTRSGSLRAIDRTLHQGDMDRLRVGFPRLGPGGIRGHDIISQTDVFGSEYFIGVQAEEGVTISYSIDIRGRVQGEVWRDVDGTVLGELVNTWSGDRLMSVLWSSAEEERRIEFEYNADGDRIVERIFRNGVLERSVTWQDGREIEDVFMNGRLVLRAIWEDGVKISEERVSPARGRP